MVDKGLMLVKVIFCFMPLIGMTFLISWIMDEDRNDKRDNKGQLNLSNNI